MSAISTTSTSHYAISIWMDNATSKILAALQDLDAFWTPLDASASEKTYRTFLLDAERLTGNNRRYLIELVCLIARAQSLQHQIPAAKASLKDAEEMLNQLQTEYRVPVRIRWLLEKGRLHILEKTPSQARILFAEAWTLAIHSNQDYLAVEIAQMMALIEPNKIRDKWTVRAIEIAESSPHQKTKRWLGGLYTQLGWTLYDLRQFENSLAAFESALQHFHLHGTEREVIVAKWATGKVLRRMGQIEAALSIQEGLLAESKLSGVRDGRLYEELAECLQSLRRSTEAQMYFGLAYQEMSRDTWVADNQPLKLMRMKNLAKLK